MSPRRQQLTLNVLPHAIGLRTHADVGKLHLGIAFLLSPTLSSFCVLRRPHSVLTVYRVRTQIFV